MNLQQSRAKPMLMRHLIFAMLIFPLVLALAGRGMAADKRLVILPLTFYIDESKGYLRQGIKSMLVSRLSGEGLEMVSDEALAPLLTEKERQGITSEKRAEELARQLKAEYALLGSVTGVGTGYSLDLTVMDLSKSEAKVRKVSEAVTEDQLIPKLSDIAYDIRAIIAGVDIRKPAAAPVPEDTARSLFFRPSGGESPALKPTGGFSLRAAVVAMDIGDLDGDGQKELVVLARKSLMVYKKRQRSYELKDTLEPATGEEFIEVSVADLDRNGRAEIYLVSRYGQLAYTSVWEWSGKFKKLIDRQRGHYYAVKGQGTGRDVLLFQDSGVDRFFMGKQWFASYENGALTKKEPMPDLNGAQLYTLVLYDVDKDGAPEFIGLGQPDLYEKAPICIWDPKGNVLWQSADKVGGTNNAIRSGVTRPGEQPPRVSFNSRLVVTDVEKNGKKDLLAVNNIPVTKYLDFWLYEKGNLAAFKIEGRTLTELYKSRDIPYCITDIQVDGQTIFLAGSKGEIVRFGEGTSRIMWFE